MKFMLLFQEPMSEFDKAADPATAVPHMDGWMSYIGAMQQAGIMRGGEGLMPPHTASVVRLRGGKRQVQDGPYADTHEHLGGFVVIDVPTLDDALGWAERAPCAAAGSIEVRPTLAEPAA